jgi:YVTN family beta-propeller protein
MRVLRGHHAALIAASVAVLIPMLPQAADAATPHARPYPVSRPIAGLASAAQMVYAKGHLFVSSGTSGSAIVVLSTAGKRVGAITDEPGADGMVVSPNGSEIYVALANSDAIAVLNTATLEEITKITVDSCPHSLALAGGRLFYSFGCDGAMPADEGVSSVDPDGGGTPVPALGYLFANALLRGDGSVLAATDLTNRLTTYTAASDGSLTQIGTGLLPESPEDMAFTSNGNSVLVASGSPYQITSYATATGSQNLVYPGVAYPQAVATDPTGHYVAGGFKSYNATAMLYRESSGSILWQRYTASSNPAYWSTNVSFDAMDPQTLVFSPSGTQVYGLVTRENTNGLFFFDSAVAPKTSAVKVSVPNVGFGRDHTATARVTGAPGAPVTFTLTDNGTTRDLGTVDANRHGVARKVFAGTYNGTVSASFEGSAAKYPATAKAKFTVASKTSSRLVGPHTTRHGVAFYSSYKDVNILFSTTPKQALRATRTDFEELLGGHWRIVGRLSKDENQAGLRVYFKSAPSNVEIRVHLIVPADSLSRGSAATSKVFEID